MITTNGVHGNGHGVQPLSCEPQPGWRAQFPAFTHNLSWVDGDGHSHSMTLRSDTLTDLMSDLQLLKAAIRQAKGKQQQTPGAVPCASATPQPSHEPQVPPASVPDVLPCPIHGVSMERRWSRRTGGSYFSHRLGDGSLCYGKLK